MYECTVEGGFGGITVWKLEGTGFQSVCEIELRHTLFVANIPISCDNNVTMTAQGLGNDTNNFTSQINITFSPDIITEESVLTISCCYDNGTSIVPFGNKSFSTGMYNSITVHVVY